MSSFRAKQVGHLKDFLNDLQVFDVKSLRRLIEGKAEIVHGEAAFKVLRAEDLRLDEEQRFYGDRFEYRETIFDCGDIRLRNSLQVRLVDCLVLGALSIGDRSDGLTSVYLDTVAVTGKLQIVGHGEPMGTVGLVSVQAKALDLFNFTTSEAAVMDCRFASTEIRNLGGNSLKLTSSQFGRLSIAECDFEEVTFPVGQVNLAHLNASRLRTYLRSRRFNPLKFSVGFKAIDREMAAASRADAKRQMIETLRFLAERSETTHSKRDAAQLKYLRALAESPGWLSRLFVLSTGGFIKPWRIVAWTAIVIFGFAEVFWRGHSTFGTSVGSFWDALYFSGLTFTTIGYGDIVPSHEMRGFAVFEGLLGVALGGAFLVSLTRRYIE